MFAVLGACGVAGAVPSAALAGSSSVADWTKLAPRRIRLPGDAAAMAHDAASRTVVSPA